MLFRELHIVKYIVLPAIANLAGLFLVARFACDSLMNDYLFGTIPGFLVAILWLFQVKLSIGADTVKFIGFALGRVFIKLLVMTIVFFSVYAFTNVNMVFFAISFIVYNFFQLISELVFYIRRDNIFLDND